jgi:hypothetical protein
MGSKSQDLFLTIRSEGAILPPDLLQRIVAGDRELDGLKADDYHLPKGEKINEATSRAWNRLLGVWTSFRAAIEKVPETDPATTATRERWLQPFFQELGYGRLLTAKAIEVEGKSYAISHGWNRTPIHLVGCHIDLDRSAQRASGASRSSPHSLLQETLNRSTSHLWGFVTNGLQMRILRNNASLSRQAFVEFDLEAMMLGENYADYVLLWLLCHQSRVEADNPNDCWLEKWSQASKERGVRALDHLRRGVELAITALGRGFLSCPSNRQLRDRLRTGTLDPQDYYRQLLRLVYRLLFLFSAEDRRLLLVPGDAHGPARGRFLSYYSTARLRRLAGRRAGTRHTDLFAALRLVMAKLSNDSGCPELALPALGGFLFSAQALPDLEASDISNFDLCEAVRALAVTVSNGVRRPVDYKNLGAEELGSVYESLLELHPRVNLDAATFELNVASGHERKTTGSYYTPTSLIDCLLDSALDPVLEEAARKPEPERAVLALKIVDPACGSGHFLIAAAHRIAKRLASERTGDEEPSPEFTRTALRDVIGHCIYGVDINPMAVELCKVNLWMEALEPGRPLSFLEHHIQCGNALLGATPTLLTDGIPDGAFTPIEGDDRDACSKWKKVNKAERASRAKKQERFDFDAPWMKLGKIAEGILAVDSLGDESIERIREKERLYEQAVRSGDYLDGRFLADAWCAAFVWKKNSLIDFPITEDIFRQIEQNPNAFHNDKCAMTVEIQRLAQQYQFVHWHLNFPGLFRPAPVADDADNKFTGWNGGFDVVIGNPPWERMKLQEKEWFSERRPDIAGAMNAVGRKRDIAMLQAEEPALWADWQGSLREADGETSLVRNTGRFPLCGRGDVNTFSIFAELNRSLVAPNGRAGCIVPTGIATDATTQLLFKDLMDTRSLVCLYGFENEGKLFDAVDHRVNFCVLVFGKSTLMDAEFAAFLRHPDLLREENRRYRLNANDIALLNPNTHTCPVFRTSQDAELTKSIYRKVPVLWGDDRLIGNPWGASFRSMFHMSGDSALFRVPEQLTTDGWELEGNTFVRERSRMLPLYEAKMIYHFNHRFGDFGLVDSGDRAHILPTPGHDLLVRPEYLPMARYWVAEKDVRTRIDDWWSHEWFIGWRDVTDPRSSARTVIPCIIPRTAVSGKFPLLLTQKKPRWFIYSILASFVFDYVARQKIGGVSLSMFVMRQLPVLPPSVASATCAWSGAAEDVAGFILPRVMELTYTAWDMKPFAVEYGFDCPPFRWDEGRRLLLRCELDAAFFHLYLGSEDEGCKQPDVLTQVFPSPRDAVEYIMNSFPIVRRKEEQQYNEYRTKRVILEIYDAMAEAQRTGTPYQTRLDPPPADPRVAHPAMEQPVALPFLRATVGQLSQFPAAAWATPDLVAPEHLALFALIDVIRAFNGSAKPGDVRAAAILVRNPAMALAFLDQPRAREWVRVIGAEARPLPANVVKISQFQRNATDLPWANAMSQLTGSGALQTGADRWIATDNFPVSSGQDWVAGRAAIAVELVSILAGEIEERLTDFLRSVGDGTAIRAVS